MQRRREETQEEKQRGRVVSKLGDNNAGMRISDGGIYWGGPWQQETSRDLPQRVRFLRNSSLSRGSPEDGRMIEDLRSGLVGQTRATRGSIPDVLVRTRAMTEATIPTTGSTPGTPSDDIDSIIRSSYASQTNRGLGLIFRDGVRGGVEAVARSALERRPRGRMNATVEGVRDSDANPMESRFRGLTTREEIGAEAESRDRAHGRLAPHMNGLSRLNAHRGLMMQRSADRSGRFT